MIASHQTEATADLNHFYCANLEQAVACADQLTADEVVAVLDVRDPVARDWARASGASDRQIREHVATMNRVRQIPTMFIALPRTAAVLLLAKSTTNQSRMLASIPPEAGRVVIAITAGLTRMVKLA